MAERSQLGFTKARLNARPSTIVTACAYNVTRVVLLMIEGNFIAIL
jgi:hypothetical protein